MSKAKKKGIPCCPSRFLQVNATIIHVVPQFKYLVVFLDLPLLLLSLSGTQV